MSEELRKSLIRWSIFALVAVVITTSLLLGGVSDFKPGPVVQKVYDEVEKLPEGSPILISSDFDPGSEAELKPMVEAVLAQCWRKNLRVIVMSICSVNSPKLADSIVRASADAHGKVYGTDYVIFGYQAGGSAPILALGQDWHAVYKTDFGGKPARDYPAMKGINRLTDFPICLEMSAVSTVDYWILAGNAKYGLKLGLGVTAVMATDYYQYLATGQVVGIIGGVSGASQYESMTRQDAIRQAREKPEEAADLASTRMPTQSAIHVTIILLVVFGNILYFLEKRKAKQ